MNWRWKIAQSAEIRWWKNYLKIKSKADYFKWKSNYWTSLLSKINLSIKKEQQILDVGCGPAGIYMILNENELDAVDPLLNHYEEALDHFQSIDYQNVSFYPEKFEDFEIQKKYDLVFCLNAINHVANLEACFEKLHQAVKPNGSLILSIDTHNFSFLKFLFRLLPGDILHPHQYDLKEYKTMLTHLGFEIQKTQLLKKEFIFDYYILIGIKN